VSWSTGNSGGADMAAVAAKAVTQHASTVRQDRKYGRKVMSSLQITGFRFADD